MCVDHAGGGGGGGHSNTSVEHMRNQPEKHEKRVVFLTLNAIRGQNMPVFKKKGPF